MCAIGRWSMATVLKLAYSPAERSMSSSVRRIRILSQHLTSDKRNMSASTGPESEALFSSDGGVRNILLNRPKALNALNLNMAQIITREMKAFESDPCVHMVVMEGAGDKAFCAGGDIIAVTEAGKVGGSLAQEFFQYEYSLNHLIGVYKKPFLAVQDGITMGGGVGLSVHGDFRIATEHTLFAMPETFIGLFPDVGGSYFLPRLSGSIGLYLALTGYRLKARDNVFAGIATHFIPRAQIPVLKDCLSDLCTSNGKLSCFSRNEHRQIVGRELDNLHQKFLTEHSQDEFSLTPHLDCINRCFNQESIEEILDALQREGSDWAQLQIMTLSKMSPTSLKVTHHQLRKGKGMSITECLKMEYRMSQMFMARKDFYEGVRALLVDKDSNPQWTPSHLKDVTQQDVISYFDRLPDDKELEI